MNHLPQQPQRCPADEVWNALVLDCPTVEWDDRPGSELLAHAALCPECGSRLHEAIVLFQAPPTIEELRFVNKGSDRMSVRGVRYWPIAAAVLLCASIAVGWKIWNETRPPFVLIAQVYTEQRSIELRLPGAAYARFQAERGGSDVSPLANQAELRLRNAPRSVEWLQAKGRLLLLQWRPKEAIEAFQEAMDLGEPAAVLLADASMAYFERAVANNATIDYTQALELVTQAISSGPPRPEYYFNRAIIHEKLANFAQAEEDWRRCLEMEPSGPWADESRQRLRAVEERRKRLYSSDWESKSLEYVEERLDRLLQSAPTLDSLRSGITAAALARTLLERHRDPWLDALLRAEPTRADRQAFLALRRTAEPTGPSAAARSEALGVVNRAALSNPMRAWLDFERVYVVSHEKPKDCVSIERRPALQSATLPYPQLRISLLLERSTCQATIGKTMEADRSTKEAIQLSASHGFEVLLARAYSFHTSHLISGGHYREALNISRKMIEWVYNRNLPARRLHNFQNDFYRSGEQMQRWSTAAEGARTTAEIARLNGMRDLELRLRAVSAESFLRLGDTSSATREYRLAEELDHTLYSGASMSESRAIAALALARARRDAQSLASLEESMQAAHSPFWTISFRISKAAFERISGRPEIALAHLDSVLATLRGQSPSRRWRRPMEEAYRLSVASLISSGRLQEAFARWQEFRSQDSQLLGGPVSRLATSAPPGVLQISFVGLEGRYKIFSRIGPSVTFRWIEEQGGRIDRLTRQFRRSCLQPDSEAESTALQSTQLWALLIAPIEPLLQSVESIEFQLDGGLSALPVHALQPRPGQPLIARLPVSYRLGPFAETDNHLQADPPYANAGIAAATFVHPEFRPAYPPLPDLDLEGNEIAALFPHSRILLGRETTAAHLTGLLASVAVFHFSGHSAVSPAGNVSLLIAPDNGDRGYYTLPSGLSHAPDLAFLAACATAEVEEFDSVAPLHLAHAFVNAGVRQVVAAQWNLDHASAQRMVRSFYRFLLETRRPGVALQKSIASMLRSGPLPPYYWGPYALYS